MSTTTDPETEPLQDDAQIVDLLIAAVVLDAALARLPLVQAAERAKAGKRSTTLSTLSIDILKAWQPGDTKRPAAPVEAECPNCGRTVKTYQTGKLRVHGPPDERCPEAYAKNARGKSDTRPLRFPMNRAEYEAIRDRIHMHGQSVASVISQRLAHFARHGAL